MKKLLLLFVLPLFVYAKEVTIAVIAIHGLQTALKEWQPTIDHIQKALPQHQFKLVAYKPTEVFRLKDAIDAKSVDFVITQPAIYIELELEKGVSKILTMIKHLGIAQFGSVLITHKKSQITQLKQIKGKTVSAVAPLGFGGWLIGYEILLKEGFDPLKDARVTFEGTQINVVRAVLNQQSSVGVIRTGLLEKLQKKGFKGLEQLRVLNPQIRNDFPFKLSSPLYPEWALAKSLDTPHPLAVEVAKAFLTITKDSKAAQSASYESWTVPYDYQPVHELMQNLRVGPYKDYGKVTIAAFISEYRYLFTVVSMLFVLLIVFLIYNRYMNKKLYTERELKNKALNEQETIFDLQVSLLFVIKNHKLIHANKAFLRFFGVTSIETFNKQHPFIIEFFEYQEDSSYLSTKLHGKQWIDLLLNNPKEHYKVKINKTIFAINLKELSAEEGSYIVMLSDITYLEDSKVYLESQIALAKEEIREKEKELFQQSKQAAMGGLIGIIAHQLKQPLSVISTLNNNLLLDIGLDNYDPQDFHQKIELSNQNIFIMSSTIDDFRTFFSPNKRAASFLLDHCITWVITLLQPNLHTHNIKLIYEQNRDLTYFGLENELFHVIMNIINNAQDALVDKKPTNPFIKISLLKEDDKSKIIIEDNAGGIDQHIIDKIFDQYFTTKGKEGTGLGLYLTKIIVKESLNGDIEVVNTKEGAKFIISL